MNRPLDIIDGRASPSSSSPLAIALIISFFNCTYIGVSLSNNILIKSLPPLNPDYIYLSYMLYILYNKYIKIQYHNFF